MICVEQRGRADSEWDPDPSRYQPLTYVADMLDLLRHLKVEQVIAVGTSLGGIMTILLQAMHPGILRAAIINDIGPEIDPRGLLRIQSYVGKYPPPADWAGAVDQVKAANAGVFPGFNDADWERFTRKLYREISDLVIGMPRPLPATLGPRG